MDKEKLEKLLGIPKDSLTQLEYVLITVVAAGGTTRTIADSLQCPEEDVQGIIDATNTRESLFDRAVAAVRIDTLGGIPDRDFGWNDLESLALIKLRRVVGTIRDPDVLTRVAVAANRARRSHEPAAGAGPTTNQIINNGPLVLAGGDLGALKLTLSHRVARQLSQPAEMAPVIDGQSSRVNSLEMLRLNDIRNIGTVEDAEEKQAIKEEKQKIFIDDGIMSQIFGGDSP